jgi:3'-phosphoadenosine 5'-phosphosulfate sulfotransferase (PAPS reductase)/FAD synthetase
MEAVEKSRLILNRAIEEFKPDFVISMVSGGNDSATAHHVAMECGIKIDAILHIITGTGIQETTDFVRGYYGNLGIPYIEASAGTAYEDYVLRKGFFGRGETAHKFAYHVLKAGPLRKALSLHFRKRKRGVKILLLNGARGEAESARRGRTKTSVFNFDPSQKKNIWVNHILHFTNEEKAEYLETRKVRINPVTVQLDRSGECLCGTMQDESVRGMAAALYPAWGKWVNNLRKRVMETFPWDWGQDIPKWVSAQKKGQCDLFMPMCQGCERSAEGRTK